MDAIAGGAGGEKLSEFRTFLLFICSGKRKKEKIYFEKYIKNVRTGEANFGNAKIGNGFVAECPPLLKYYIMILF